MFHKAAQETYSIFLNKHVSEQIIPEEQQLVQCLEEDLLI